MSDDKTNEILQLMWTDMKEMGRNINAKLDAKIDALDEKIAGLDRKIDSKIDSLDAKLSRRIDNLAAEMSSMDRRLSARIDESNSRFAILSSQLDATNLRIDRVHEDLVRELRADRVATTQMLGMLVRADKHQDTELDAIRARLEIAEAQLGLR